MAIKKQVDISVDARQAIAAMDETGKSFEQVFGEIKPLNTKIGEMEDALYQLAAAGDTSSKEFKDLSRTIGDYMKVIIDTDMQVDAMAQTTAQNMGGAIEGVSGAFAIGTGAMGAFGVESEAVGEALLRVQSAMAITQGIQSIREGAKAFRGLKAAIMASTVVQKVLNFVMNLNPIGLIVAGVVALGVAVAALLGPIKNLMSGWMGFSDTSDKVIEDMEKINGLFEKQNKLIDESIKNLNKRLEQNKRRLKIEGASEEELHKQRLKDLKSLEKARNIQKNIISIQNKEQYKLLERARKFGLEDEIETIKTTIQANRDKYNDLKLIDGDYALSVKEAEEEERKRIEAENKERRSRGRQRAAERKAAAQSDLETARQIEAEKLANTEDGREKELQAAINAERILQENLLTNDELNKAERDALKLTAQEALRIKLKAINDKFDLEEGAEQKAKDDKKKADDLAKEKKFLEDREALIKDFDARSRTEDEQKLFLLTEKYNTELLLFKDDLEKKQELTKQFEADKNQLEVDAAEKSRQAKIAKRQSDLDLAKQGLEAVSSVTNLLLDGQIAAAEGNEKKQEKLRKKAFNANKALQLGMAIIDGFKAANASLAASPVAMGFLPNPAGIASLAFSITTSLANVAKIAASRYQSSGGASATPPAGSGGGAVVPQFNVVGNSPQNQLAQSLGQGQDQPIQAFVVAGDVTSAQSLERNAIKTASL